MFNFTADGEFGCCEWPKTRCMAGVDIDEYGGIFSLLDVSGMRVPVNPSGFPEIMNSGEPTRELLGRAAPCFFKVTVEGVINYGVIESGYCVHCDNLNREYILIKDEHINNVEYKNINLLSDEYTEWAARYRALPFCSGDNHIQACGFQHVDLLIYPSSTAGFNEDGYDYARGSFAQLIQGTANMDVNMELRFTYDSFPIASSRHNLVFKKKIGTLVSNGIKIYDSDLYGPTVSGQFRIEDIQALPDEFYNTCPEISHDDNDEACNFSNVVISIEALDKYYSPRNMTNNHCSLILEETIVNTTGGGIRTGGRTMHPPGNDNNVIFLKFNDVISIANDSGNFTDVPFPSATITTCYDCEDMNGTMIELTRGTSSVFLLTHAINTNVIMEPTISGSKITDDWRADFNIVKNGASGIPPICCRDRSLPGRSYNENTESSCIDNVTFHMQKSFKRTESTLLSSQIDPDTGAPTETFRCDRYYDHYGVINFFRGGLFNTENVLVHQLYNQLCSECEVVSNEYTVATGGEPAECFGTTGTTTRTYSCVGSFNDEGWIESSGYLNDIPSGQRPCYFDNANIEALTTEISPQGSGCRMHLCPCREDMENIDVIITIQDHWRPTKDSQTPGGECNLYNCDVSPIVGTFVTTTVLDEQFPGSPFPGATCSVRSIYNFPSGTKIACDEHELAQSGYIPIDYLEFIPGVHNELGGTYGGNQSSAVLLHSSYNNQNWSIAWILENGTSGCFIAELGNGFPITHIKDCDSNTLDGNYHNPINLGSGLTPCFLWERPFTIHVEKV